MHIKRSMFKEVDRYLPLANRIKKKKNGCSSISCSECPFSRLNNTKDIYCGGEGSLFFMFNLDDCSDKRLNDMFRDFVIMAERQKIKIEW